MTSWHNALGEDGQRLTILSVLPRATPDPAATKLDRELSLREAIDEIFRIAGEDGAASVVLDVTTAAGEELFSSEENVPLRELAARLYGSFGVDGGSASVLRILEPGDDPFGGLTANGSSSETEDDGRSGLLAGLRRFREAVHRLFGGSAEEGPPPTILSLLVDPRTVHNKST